MPLGEIAGEALGGIIRFVGRILFEFVAEVLLQGTGYVLIRFFLPKTQPSDMACGLVGLAFWIAVAGLGYWGYSQIN